LSLPDQWLVKKPGRRRRHFQQIPAKGLSRSSRSSPPLHFASPDADLLATTKAATRHRAGAGEQHRLHGRSLHLHAETGQGIPVVIDTPRRTEGFQLSAGDVAYISLRRGANCPMLPS
jgi:hypothetical protein